VAPIGRSAQEEDAGRAAHRREIGAWKLDVHPRQLAAQPIDAQDGYAIPCSRDGSAGRSEGYDGGEESGAHRGQSFYNNGRGAGSSVS
jgi:hypothetical protein